MRSRGKIIGAINAQSRQPAAFSDLDVTALRILADQLANAIENARLFTELRGSEEKYRTLLDNIEEGYYELDMDGRYRFVNDALAYLLDTPKEQNPGFQFSSIYRPGIFGPGQKSLQGRLSVGRGSAWN